MGGSIEQHVGIAKSRKSEESWLETGRTCRLVVRYCAHEMRAWAIGGHIDGKRAF
jgi:hypothetical protein